MRVRKDSCLTPTSPVSATSIIPRLIRQSWWQVESLPKTKQRSFKGLKKYYHFLGKSLTTFWRIKGPLCCHCQAKPGPRSSLQTVVTRSTFTKSCSMLKQRLTSWNSKRPSLRRHSLYANHDSHSIPTPPPNIRRLNAKIRTQTRLSFNRP
jgi:hypothetical protein